MLKIRFGIRVRLPFGLFPHAAIFRKTMPASQAKEIGAKITELKNLLTLFSLGSIGEQFVFEEVE